MIVEIVANFPDGIKRKMITDEGIIKNIEICSDGSSINLWVGPGIIDLQVNGFYGINFSGQHTTIEDIIQATKLLWQTGVTHYLPTITTNDQETIRRMIKNIREAANDPETRGSILGIHLEGPYINGEDGPRGAHSKKYVRDPNWDEFLVWQEAADGLIKLVTLAPERPEAIEFIKRLAANDIVPAIGHTAAADNTIKSAVEAGARFSTHLGNGSHAVLPRHQNYIWYQLACDDLMAGIIADGHHLPPSVLKTFVRAKSIERVVLTSDMSAIAGLKPGIYEFAERDVELREDGKICLLGTDYLAGSGVEAHISLGNIIKYTNVSLEDAFKMAAYNPASLIGKNKLYGKLKEGNYANFFLFEWDQINKKVIPVSTIINGETVWSKNKVTP